MVIVPDKTYAIGEFIDQVLKERPNEWGVHKSIEYNRAM